MQKCVYEKEGVGGGENVCMVCMYVYMYVYVCMHDCMVGDERGTELGGNPRCTGVFVCVGLRGF